MIISFMNQNDLDRWVVKVGIQGGNHKIEGEKQNIFSEHQTGHSALE